MIESGNIVLLLARRCSAGWTFRDAQTYCSTVGTALRLEKRSSTTKVALIWLQARFRVSGGGGDGGCWVLMRPTVV